MAGVLKAAFWILLAAFTSTALAGSGPETACEWHCNKPDQNCSQMIAFYEDDIEQDGHGELWEHVYVDGPGDIVHKCSETSPGTIQCSGFTISYRRVVFVPDDGLSAIVTIDSRDNPPKLRFFPEYTYETC